MHLIGSANWANPWLAGLHPARLAVEGEEEAHANDPQDATVRRHDRDLDKAPARR